VYHQTVVLKSLQDLPHVDHVLLVVSAADDNIVNPGKGGVGRGRAAPQLPGEPPACAVKQGMALMINKQFVRSKKIYAQNRKSYICKKKFPRKILILESQLHQAVSPARNELTSRAKQHRAHGR
jgi:hypothetical protein